MKKNKKEIITCIGLIVLAIIYTILVKHIDVQAIGPKKALVGFATINKFIFNLIGVNTSFYHITDWLGLIPLFIGFIYATIGFIQLIKRKSLFKVDKEIIGLGVFYIILIELYVFFEIYVINYRPILMNGILEASYPSSHTLLSICVCGSSLMINEVLFNDKKIFKIENIISILSICIIVLGRLISGVHWFSDIVGSILISMALLKMLSIYFSHIKK